MIKNSDKKIVFFGTDELSASALETLLEIKANIVGVVTRPDKPIGYKHKIVFSPIKALALKHNLKIFQPNKLKEEYHQILDLKPDLILTFSYGRIIPKEIIDYPKFHCINIHPSLLPKYRGASPIQSAILNQENVTGISFIYMTTGLDDGDIIIQKDINIEERETTKSLKEKIKIEVKTLIANNFDYLFHSNLRVTKQDENRATFTSLIKRENEKINWKQPAKTIDAFVRALYDKPIAYSMINGHIVKIHECNLSNFNSTNFIPGTIINISKDGILVATQDYCLNLRKIQLEGKKPNYISTLVNGNLPFQINDKFETI